MKHHKNLSQFLDTRKAAGEWESWVHLVPVTVSVDLYASNAYGMATYWTDCPKGLTRPAIVPEGKDFLSCLSDNPEHEMSWDAGTLLVTWEKKIPQPALELSNEDGSITKIKQEPIYEKQQAEFETRLRMSGDPHPDTWLRHLKERPVRMMRRHGISAAQLKVLSNLKQGHLKSKDEPANLSITIRDGCATFRIPACEHDFMGVMTTNKLNGE